MVRALGAVCAAPLAAWLISFPTQPALAVPSGCGKSPCVNIQGFAGDVFDVGSWNGIANKERTSAIRHCVFSNRPKSGTATYNVTPSGVGTAGGAFLLTGPGGDLPYQVEIRDGRGGSIGWTVVTANTVSSFTSLSETNFDYCTNSATNSRGQRVRVTVFETDMETMQAGTYTGSLRLDVATPVGSATDSETSGTISVEIPELVRLLRLRNNFNFGTWNPDSGSQQEIADDTVCVWSNHSGGDYTVTATTTSGSFDMTSSTDVLPFQVWWSQSPGVTSVAASDQQLAYDTPATFSSTATATDCGGGSTASIVVAATENSLSAATAGSYTTSLIITIGSPP